MECIMSKRGIDPKAPDYDPAFLDKAPSTVGFLGVEAILSTRGVLIALALVIAFGVAVYKYG